MRNVASFRRKKNLTVTIFASLIGTLTSTFPGNLCGTLQYRAMSKSLKYNKGNFNVIIKLSEDILHEISQPAITYLKLTIETLEQGEKYVQS